MLDSLSYWLHETPLGEALLTMFISMLPVVELRGRTARRALQWGCRSLLRFCLRSLAI